MIDVLIDILKNIEKNGLNNGNKLYITFMTNHKDVSIPKWLYKKYPNEMTIIIQYEYYNLSVSKKNFKIGLSFNNLKADLSIDYKAITTFADPHANFGLRLQNDLMDNSNLNDKLQKSIKLPNSSLISI